MQRLKDLSEKIKVITEVATKLIDALSAKQQANVAEKVLEKIVEELTSLCKDQIIDKETLLSVINGLSVNKDLTLLMGRKKSVKIKFENAKPRCSYSS
jgi:hypothetical protein